jgi:hypothetical protein
VAEGAPWHAVIGPAAIITVATPARPAGACPLSTEIRIALVAHQDPLRVVSDIGSADIEELWRRSGQQERHRTLGLYSSILATGIEPGRAAPRAADCEEIVRAPVDLRLTERRIHIAREAANLPCFLDVAVSHLTRHAAAGGEAFNRLVGCVEGRLGSAGFKVLATAERTSGGDVDILVKVSVDQELAIYDVDRMQMRDETDTADEIDKVQNACS